MYAPIAMHLHLLEDTRTELMPHDADTSTFAYRTGDDVLFALCARSCEPASVSSGQRDEESGSHRHTARRWLCERPRTAKQA